MAQVRRIMISLPETLLAEVDIAVKEGHTNRSEFIREAMKVYIIEQRKQALRERMKAGYAAMSGVNLLLAEECLAADEECLCGYEQLLSEVGEG